MIPISHPSPPTRMTNNLTPLRCTSTMTVIKPQRKNHSNRLLVEFHHRYVHHVPNNLWWEGRAFQDDLTAWLAFVIQTDKSWTLTARTFPNHWLINSGHVFWGPLVLVSDHAFWKLLTCFGKTDRHRVSLFQQHDLNSNTYQNIWDFVQLTMRIPSSGKKPTMM